MNRTDAASLALVREISSRPQPETGVALRTERVPEAPRLPAEGGVMRHYVVVAHQTLGGAHLMEHLHHLREDDPYCRFHLVVPRRHPSTGPSSEASEAEVAQKVLDEVLDRMASMGMGATGDVGDTNPVFAAGDAVRRLGEDAVSGIIVSTLPTRASAWLRGSVPDRISKRWPRLPVTHLIAADALV